MAPDFTGHCLWLFPTSGLLGLLVPSGRCRGQTVEKLSWSSLCPLAMQVCPGCPSMIPRHQRHDFPRGNHSYCNTHLESDFSGPRPAACPGDCPMALCHEENREMLEELRIPTRWNKPCSPSWRAHDWRMSSRHEASQYSPGAGAPTWVGLCDCRSQVGSCGQAVSFLALTGVHHITPGTSGDQKGIWCG